MQIFHSFTHLAHALAHNMAHQFVHNMEQALDELGEQVEEEVKSRIGTYPQSTGKAPAFASLAQSTLERKSRAGYGIGGNPDTPLYASGDFYKNVGHTRQGYKYVRIGTTKKYIVYTELGTAKMPPRPVFQPSADYVIPKYVPRLRQFAAAGIVGVPVATFFTK